MGEEFATKEEVHGIKARLEIIERSLRREVGPALDLVETTAGVVAAAAGGTVGKVAAVVKKVADLVEGVFCPKHPDAPQTVNGCTADGCTYLAP